MVTQIVGWVLFVWMSVAVAGVSRAAQLDGGWQAGNHRSMALLFGSLAAVGLLLALSQRKRTVANLPTGHCES